MRTRAIVVMIAMLAVLASIVLAEAPKMSRRHGAWGKEIASQLNLTPQQIEQLKAIHQNFLNATKPVRDQLKTQMGEMATLWATDGTTAAQIRAKADQIDALKLQIRNAGIDAMLQARDVLTPAQRVQVREMIRTNPRLGMGLMMMGSCMHEGKRPGGAGRGHR